VILCSLDFTVARCSRRITFTTLLKIQRYSLSFVNAVTRKSSPIGDLAGFNKDRKLIASIDVQQNQIASPARTNVDDRPPALGFIQFAFQCQPQVRATVCGEAELVEARTMRGENSCLRRVTDSLVH